MRVEYTRAPRRVVREVRRVLAAADNIHATSPPCGAGKYARRGELRLFQKYRER